MRRGTIGKYVNKFKSRLDAEHERGVDNELQQVRQIKVSPNKLTKQGLQMYAKKPSTQTRVEQREAKRNNCDSILPIYGN